MTLSKPVRILVGIATFWYALYLLLTIVSMLIFFGYVLFALLAGGETISTLGTLFRQILSLEFMLPIHVCSLILEVGLLIFYLVHTIKNTKASDSADRVGARSSLPAVCGDADLLLFVYLEGKSAGMGSRERK